MFQCLAVSMTPDRDIAVRIASRWRKQAQESALDLGDELDQLIMAANAIEPWINNLNEAGRILQATNALLDSPMMQKALRDLSREIGKLKAFGAALEPLPGILRDAEMDARKILDHKDGISTEELDAFDNKFRPSLPKFFNAAGILKKLTDSPADIIEEIAEVTESRSLSKIHKTLYSVLYDVYDGSLDIEACGAAIRDFVEANSDFE